MDFFSFQCAPDGGPGECGPEYDGDAILRIRGALTRVETDQQPAGYLRVLLEEADSFQNSITSIRDKITYQINEITEERKKYNVRSTIDAAFIS